MSSLVRAGAIAAFVSSSTLALAEPGQSFVKSADPQYVLISFDNSNGIAEWKRSRALADMTGARFTYFLSCVFLIPRDRRASYDPPSLPAGKSNIGFAPSRDDIAERLTQIWGARNEGHEIGSHACGHFDGKDWSKADWMSEFRSFRTTLANAYEANGLGGEPAGWRDFANFGIKGFRAPYLSTGPGLYHALAAKGLAYDASGVSREPQQPDRSGTVARFALPQIPEGPKERRVLAMDYNLFVRHSGGSERVDEGAVFEDRAYSAFMRALDKEMAGERRPLQLGFHFTMMNGGAYWRALERFAAEACIRPDVACITYSDYLGRTETAIADGDVGG
ncbi:polysaccharide deacetylase [Arvimicrobium flavum]|uniref:polysaccharide deacetylase n=1 Tax=Arvimicrobium flavum TaxID=3393320 RepID=UPI00237B1E4C|nr:polysaccharide deacetylase [Mesorhizobium shangrilense]